MSRSVELGRAVLCSPAANLELWLTTLITISPKQDENNLQQLKPAHFLDYLSSGGVWVGRGHGMHIRMKLTLREEEVGFGQLQDLTEAIVQAPIWEQLMLRATVPGNVVIEPGTIHLNIDHANHSGIQEKRKSYMLFPHVPVVDVRPPDDVPSVFLQCVCLSIDILETSRPRRKPTTKRSDTLPDERKNTKRSFEDSDVFLYDAVPEDNAMCDNVLKHTAARSPSQKRKRPATDDASASHCSSSEAFDGVKRPHRPPSIDVSTTPNSPPDLAFHNRLNIENLLDGALRLSICGNLAKPSNGLKVKASTFRLGLSDLAPSLWKPGYLTALSQRAHLIPTIARSLGEVGCARASSISLKDKISSLTAVTDEGLFKDSRDNGPISGEDFNSSNSSVAGRLWAHVQKRLINKSTAPLQALLASDVHVTHPDSDDMLAEVECETSHQRKPTLTTSSISVDKVKKVEPFGDGSILHPTRSSSLAAIEGQAKEPTSEGSNSRTNADYLEDDLLLDPTSHNIVSMEGLLVDEDITAPRHQPHFQGSVATASLHALWHTEHSTEHSTDHTKNSSSDSGHSSMLAEHDMLEGGDSLFGQCGEHIDGSANLTLPF